MLQDSTWRIGNKLDSKVKRVMAFPIVKQTLKTICVDSTPTTNKMFRLQQDSLMMALISLLFCKIYY